MLVVGEQTQGGYNLIGEANLDKVVEGILRILDNIVQKTHDTFRNDSLTNKILELSTKKLYHKLTLFSTGF